VAFHSVAGMHQMFANMCTSTYRMKQGTGSNHTWITSESVNLASFISEEPWILLWQLQQRNKRIIIIQIQPSTQQSLLI
jgi:hypothetical protein